MTIALDATSLTAHTGGIARYTLELALALARAFPGDEYWLLSDQPFTLPPGLPPNLQSGGAAATPASRRWWLWGLNKEMTRLGAALFHGTDFSVPYLERRPSVMTLHDLSPWMDRRWQPGAARVRRRTPRLLKLGLATMVITPSESVRQAAIERFNLNPERVAAIPHAASARFEPVPPVPGKPYFLHVGTLEPRKNIGRLIGAWREVKKSLDIDLVLAGRVRDDFTAPAPEPGLRLLGPVPDDDLPGLYSSALACVYPSLYEGFGLPVLEAMQCGALVITSRDPAILEVTGGAAIHVEATDTSALASALSAVAHRGEEFAGLRDNALKRAHEFTWRRTAERTREVYDTATRIFHAR